MIRKFTLLSCICFACCHLAYAQQLPQSSQYWLNPFQWNVAAAGSEQTLVATAGLRKQWTQLVGAPETQHFNVHLPFDMVQSGVGLSVQNDKIGAHQIVGARVAYAYHVYQSRSLRVSLGLGVGVDQYQLDGAKLRTPEGTYNETTGLFNHQDDFISEGLTRASGLSAQAGVWVQSRRFSGGITAEPAYGQPFRYDAMKQGKISRPNHFGLLAKYTVPLFYNLELTPALHVQSDLVQTQSNIALQVGYKNNLFGAIGFRGTGFGDVESMTYLVGGRINPNMILGYSFDVLTLPLQTSSRGSHELLLRYTLSKPLGSGKLPPVIYNPRYL
jgi:type IX secretion system PorP/SprF family membrane protein